MLLLFLINIRETKPLKECQKDVSLIKTNMVEPACRQDHIGSIRCNYLSIIVQGIKTRVSGAIHIQLQRYSIE